MGRIYASPKELNEPQIGGPKFDFDAYEKECDAYLIRLRDWCLKRNPRGGKYVGKIARFGVADGYAQYMVAGIRPVELVHIAIMDAYQFPYVDRLKAKDITTLIDHSEELEKLFARKA